MTVLDKSACELPARMQFVKQVDKVFRSRTTDGGAFELYLIAVEEHVVTEIHENFSLIFRGPVDMPPEQKIYRLESEDTEPFDVFLVPIRRDEDGLVVEAVFNLVRQPGAEPRSANA